MALCYHRLEYFDVSQEVLAVYLQAYQGSAIALNLRACNTFRLYNGAAAEKELKPLINIMVCSFCFAKKSIHNYDFAMIIITPVVFKSCYSLQNQHEQTKHNVYSNAYDLIKHNLVVFRSGEGALQVLPKLLDVIPEARLNLVIYYLQQVGSHCQLYMVFYYCHFL